MIKRLKLFCQAWIALLLIYIMGYKVGLCLIIPRSFITLRHELHKLRMSLEPNLYHFYSKVRDEWGEYYFPGSMDKKKFLEPRILWLKQYTNFKYLKHGKSICTL